ncbi:organic solvent tolerance protein OstA [Lysinibacillus fusiformis]|uniref:organic solvent tolerance protein OstA n=1 Tax=Lysinibacillus fusiformis TaxID=28031 RepID=UPI002E242890|nr:organic solvent tolerance protein OstA [Lysinibacillus fusiformis]
MKKLLNQKEQHYADTREEAEEIVVAAKENEALIMYKINEKYNKYGQYFLVDLTYQYGTPKEVMEGKPKDDAPDGQMSIEEVHEGVPYTVNPDGSVKVENADEELPEFEDPFADVEVKEFPDENVSF